MPDITILGEAMVELSPTDDPSLMGIGFAGDTFNTAWYLAQLWGNAGRVRYATKIGQDETSAAFRKFTENAGITTELIEAHETRGMGLYMIHLNAGERSFSYWRDTSAARTLANDADYLDTALSASKNIYLTGISVAILPQEGRNRLAKALTDARKSGHRVIYDTNVRPKLWESAEAMARETERFAGCSDIVLPSFEDEAKHFNHSKPDATAAHYRSLGASLVVVKNADQPVLVSNAAGNQYIPQIAIDAPVDTTAAGDSFNAGFLADYLVSGDPIRAVAAASPLARRVVMGKGALVAGAVQTTLSP